MPEEAKTIIKGKKYVRKRASKKEKEDPVARELRLIAQTGKVEYGWKKTVKNALLGKGKLVIIAENLPSERKEDILYYCKLSDLPIFQFSGSSILLGQICGKPHPVSAMTIYEEGEGDLKVFLKGRKK